MLIRMHDVGRDFPGLREVHGIDMYSLRALLLDGDEAVIPAGLSELDEILSDYRQAGVGPRDVIQVPVNGSGLYGALLNHDSARQKIVYQLERGARLDLFCASEAAEKFARDLEIDWDQHTSNPQRVHAEAWNDKARLRTSATCAGLDTLFPAHRVVSRRKKLRRAVKVFSRNGAHGVALKRPDSASSEGMVFLPKGGDPSTFLNTYFSTSVPSIVEEAWEHYPWSMVFDISDDGPAFVHASLQIMGGVDIGQLVRLADLQRGIPHRGNVVGSHGLDLGPLTWSVIEETAQRLMSLMGLVYDSGYRGKICADLLLTDDGRIFVVEFNARTSNSMYVQGVNQSVSQKWNSHAVSVGANIAVNPSITSYEMARARLGGLLTKGNELGRPGVLLYHTPLISLGLGKAGLIATASTYAEALDIFHQAEALLS